jgi:AraC-like DNA-binding protein
LTRHDDAVDNSGHLARQFATEVQEIVALDLPIAGIQNVRPAGGAPQFDTAENEEASQRVGWLTEVPTLLREFGVDPVEVAVGAGLDPDALDAPENRIAFVAMGRLLHDCAVKTGCHHFALLLGQRIRTGLLGLPGQLAFYSPTLRAAVQSFAVYQHLNSQGLATFLLENDGVATLGPVVYQRGAEHVDQIYDVTIAGTLAFMRELSGARWRPERVLFSHLKPADTSAYRRFFQAPCEFNSERTALVFPAGLLDRVLASADPERLRVLEVQAHAKDKSDVALRLRRTLRTLLLGQGVSAEEVARLLSMHRRTLNRRLRAEGTTFQTLLDEVRFEAACQLLDTALTPITEIAVSLGYAETSAFSRAFRRWSGATPVERRRSVQKQLPRAGRSLSHA